MHQVIVIGAGPAGLALGACLRAEGLEPLILERAATVGSAWRRHYDRLALHTDRDRSHLPFTPFPRDWPRYVPRAQVVDYLEGYAVEHGLVPRFGAEVTGVARQGEGWRVTLRGSELLQARHVIFATGVSETPFRASWPGLEGFPGPVLHSRDYRRPGDLPGQRVLVVGFGNSGGELAIDLVEAGRNVEIAVRSPVNLLPKELLGRPIGNWDVLQRIFPYRVADAITAPVLRLMLGDYRRYGLRKAAKGPIAQIREDGRIPLIDLGTLALMRAGRLRARPGPERIEGATVTFTDGSTGAYDAILLATGYTVDLRPMLGKMPGVLDETGRPLRSGAELAPGLWFCSYHTVPNGQLREIARQAPEIARGVAARLDQAAAPAAAR
ncbi:Pyridine nucleotide-disulphide oxidoreductase [Lutimaribacter pacificus]|uniref:Pyridine nucleotide-disulphide oxidoreductase n=1 Tax=Lutimaribacter pacificus TaxID=391948 RepID=A0A1H0BV96_9RHOB|nr:NAD(P)/FAD-dependent oxidoreductase [Lutimaribacter pacificus]SDN49559.1 Pyridine nucleotide-disulphide oxidoreductase [Lutimaribacter pacificus]SHJ51841.1 Pyridine nucleotide-disulphide oxidoreductase [Lutimaribacter pacificus]